ncbi:cell adhesion molecule Dscam1-like [Ornithodoros turicata]|uniref:cell adhesion molecule Dscam1-like n=1 Tax=Ornithodoros turicata TaxID=34597 RepID=UPI003139CE7C
MTHSSKSNSLFYWTYCTTMFKMCHSPLLFAALLSALRIPVVRAKSELEVGSPPSFLREPPGSVLYSNTTGSLVPCTASGDPRPSIIWTNETGQPLEPAPGLRRVRLDGALEFQPFRAEEYRQDVHAAVYRCIASNTLGAVVSRNVHVRAVIQQPYEVRVYDDFVVRTNTGVLRCHVPNYAKEYVAVTSWVRSDGLIISVQAIPDENSKYVAFSTGELHVRRAGPEDSRHSFQCQTKDTLSGTTTKSTTTGKLVITEPHSSLPPKVIHWSRQVIGSQGAPVFLPCEAQGHPTPAYRWYRSYADRLKPLLLGPAAAGPGTLLVGGTLVLRHASVQDSATYVCVVANSAGEEKNEVHLLVTEPLDVQLWPRSKEVRSGDAVTLNCTVSGYPVRSVTWTKNSRPVQPSRRIALLNRYALRIHAVQSEDSGIYQCIASNEQDSAQGLSFVSIKAEAPVLVSRFEEVVVRREEPVSLRCAATGIPLPQITWSVYDVQVQDSNRVRVGDYVSRDGSVISFVNFTRIHTEDGGSYRCEATNDHGRDTHTARLNVMGTPSVQPMPNRTIVAGKLFVLHCPFSGYPITKVYWRKDGKNIPHSKRIMSYPNGSLVIDTVSRNDDQGHYTCFVQNELGNEARSHVNIKVIVPPSITPFSFPEKPQVGLRASVTCSVPDGDPPIQLSWLRDGIPILSPRTQGISLGHVDDFISTLVFKSLTEEHTAVYTCLAHNKAASVNYSAPLVVYAPPRWRVEPVDLTAKTSEKVVLDCQADGTPEPRVRWKKSAGTPSSEFRTIISSSRMQALVNGSLVIQEVETSDAGSYMCEASNGVGLPLYTVVQMSVHAPAKVKQRFLSHVTRRGQMVTLRCDATGDKPLNFFWMKDGQPIKTFSSPRYMVKDHSAEYSAWSALEILSAERNDTGTLRCEVSNAFGHDEQTTHLTVQDRPDAPPRPEALNVVSRAVTIIWKSPMNGNSPVVKYIVQYKRSVDSWEKHLSEMIAEADQSQVTVQDLHPLTEYNFRVLAENAIGVGPSSDVLTVITEGEVPATPPQNVKVAAIGSKKIEVTWRPPPQHLQYGDIQGYYVGYRVQGSADPYVFKTITKSSDTTVKCVIDNLLRATAYAVVVQAYNEKGAGPLSDEIRVQTYEHDPPPPPVVNVVTRTTNSIELSWSPQGQPSEAIEGYIARYRLHEGVDWNEISLGPDKSGYTFDGLVCGGTYHFSVLTFNQNGRSDPGQELQVKTEGSVPQPPSQRNAVMPNITSFVLVLNSWKDAGCPISHFFVQYRIKEDPDWTLFSSRILPDKDNIVINELLPGTWYTIMVMAFNSAGSTKVEYNVGTLTHAGSPLVPDKMAETGRENVHRYRNLSIIVPICCSIIVLIAISVAVMVLLCRRRTSSSSPPPGMTTYEGVRMCEDLKADSLIMTELEKASNDRDYYPSPYASSKVADIGRCDEELRGVGEHSRVLSSAASAASVSSPYRSSRLVEHTYDVPQHPREGAKTHLYKGDMECVVNKDKLQNHVVSELGKKEQYYQRIAGKGRPSAYGLVHSDPNQLAAYQWSDPSEIDRLDRWCLTERDIHLSAFHMPSSVGNVPEFSEISDTECDRDLERFENGGR